MLTLETSAPALRRGWVRQRPRCWSEGAGRGIARAGRAAGGRARPARDRRATDEEQGPVLSGGAVPRAVADRTGAVKFELPFLRAFPRPGPSPKRETSQPGAFYRSRLRLPAAQPAGDRWKPAHRVT